MEEIGEQGEARHVCHALGDQHEVERGVLAVEASTLLLLLLLFLLLVFLSSHHGGRRALGGVFGKGWDGGAGAAEARRCVGLEGGWVGGKAVPSAVAASEPHPFVRGVEPGDD